MEVHEWATRILGADTLEDKLFCPPILTDHCPGPASFWNEPTRPKGMELQRRRNKSEKLPPFHTLDHPDNRAVCLHRFAGHELLAVEIMAHALVAFPEAPPHFRKGLVHTLKDEQRHVRLYIERMEALGLRFGDLPLYRHFWNHVKYLTSPIRYVSTMSLTFEMANLDFAPMYGESFARYEDKDSADLMATILHDEIAHVSFGMHWLKKFKAPEEGTWDAWTKAQSDLLSPNRAKGFLVHSDHRRAAGVPEDWIRRFEEL
ncbi:MAG: DUF455 family protein [Chlamydiia bacterium]|nr:DUF455 family protein [Chlamydiia bacterium]